MVDEADHNKILNQAARTVLKPFGLFQKGQSRTWIDDNGWFLILVEFQPSNWNKGSYLNVAIHFLWQQQDYMSFDYGGREGSFIQFTGDEKKFYDEVVSLAEKAKTIVTEYRKFMDIGFAKEQMVKHNTRSVSSELYNKMMICGMAKDGRAMKFYKQLLKEVQNSTLGYEIDICRELTEEVDEIIKDRDAFYDYIANKIALQRMFWHEKSSMKKLKPEFREYKK